MFIFTENHVDWLPTDRPTGKQTRTRRTITSVNRRKGPGSARCYYSVRVAHELA